MVLFIWYFDLVFYEGERIAVNEYYEGRGELCDIV